MKRVINAEAAARVSFVLYGVFIVFHILVIAGIVPSNIVWGGRTTTRVELVRMEIASLLVQFVCVGLTLAKVVSLRTGRMRVIADIGMWVLFGLFTLNTIGNLFAVSLFEKLAFTPVTALLALLALRLAIERPRSTPGRPA